MERLKCEICGKAIFKSAHSDINLCSKCEDSMPMEDYRYAFIEKKQKTI
ncbi:MAG TPA: hypothetical protein VJI97_02825 [Candidatus Nanoarchaeia archaeon]|nr:hypothetical protein [Candidatus Nanoarchaeia archaeon]